MTDAEGVRLEQMFHQMEIEEEEEEGDDERAGHGPPARFCACTFLRKYLLRLYVSAEVSQVSVR